jgi:nitroreductase
VFTEELIMSKIAETYQPILEILQKRWSPRAFSDQPIKQATIDILIEAARWTPSAYNEQPWRFIIATKENEEKYQKLLNCLGEFNQVWAKSAPVLMITVARKKLTLNGELNVHAWHDLGAAMANLTAQATSEDIYVHQMAGFSAEKARDTFQISDDYEAVTAVAIGYLGDPNQLPDKLKERELAPRERKPISELIL